MEITLAPTQQCLKQFIDMQVRKITIEAIQRAVAEQFGLKVTDLKQKNNSRNVVVPRQIAMYLAKQMTEASLLEIGRQFGNKHHTTVMHSIGKIDEKRRTDKDLHRVIERLWRICAVPEDHAVPSANLERSHHAGCVQKCCSNGLPV